MPVLQKCRFRRPTRLREHRRGQTSRKALLILVLSVSDWKSESIMKVWDCWQPTGGRTPEFQSFCSLMCGACNWSSGLQNLWKWNNFNAISSNKSANFRFTMSSSSLGRFRTQYDVPGPCLVKRTDPWSLWGEEWRFFNPLGSLNPDDDLKTWLVRIFVLCNGEKEDGRWCECVGRRKHL